MKVRVWISGEEGPSHDFELLDAPRVGEQVTIALSDHSEDGIVTSVSWHLQGIERSGEALSIEGEPLGSVAVVHVVCRPKPHGLTLAYERAEVDTAESALQ